MKMKGNMRVIISGGGTGGHIFPAISIANAIKEGEPDAEILFVGAEGRMEMTRVPEAGYEIKGLPICGFDRKHLLKNFVVLFKILNSQWKAYRIIKSFKPHVVVGVGGFASGPTLKTAAMMGIPTLIQEQNSYAGVTNKLLARSAKKICVAYEGMERFFDKEKIVVTGNPVRQNLLQAVVSRDEAVRHWGLDSAKKTILVIGGSLGAGTLNNCMLSGLEEIRQSGVQFIWQTGKGYFRQVQDAVGDKGEYPMLYVTDFISKMEYAYSAADLIISRAGAGSISEFCLLKKPVILVPSPNVAEDHQTKNALALVDKCAALYVSDGEAGGKLLDLAVQTVQNPGLLEQLSTNIAKFAHYNSAGMIAEEVCKLAKTYKG